MITYKGKDYPTGVDPTTGYTISVESLQAVLLIDMEVFKSKIAQKIDETIYFYVPDDLLDCGADEEIADYIKQNL